MFLLANGATPWAQDKEPLGSSRFELETMVVTGTRIEDEVKRVPRNVTVITAEDIAQAPSNNLIDLLAREAGVQLRSLFGHDKWGGVDIRGMGDTYASNVVVLVDGVRINPPDARTPDFSSIPLDRIERIEVVRGAGTVAHGDGAVGGVINIITKKGRDAFRADLLASYGAYDTTDGRASIGGRFKSIRYHLNADTYRTDGYRENGYLYKRDLGLRADAEPTEFLTLSLSASVHDDDYGLPGPVSEKDIDSETARRESLYPDDQGTTRQQAFAGAFELNLGPWGLFNLERSYRFRRADYILGYSPLLSKEDQQDEIDEDTKTFSLTWLKVFQLAGLEHRVQAGIEHFNTRYVRESPSQSTRKNSQVDRTAGFLTAQWGLPHSVTLEMGWRHSRFSGLFREDDYQWFGNVQRWVNGDRYDRDWQNDAYELGLVFEARPGWTLFTSWATSFRTPNVDELALGDADLGPQQGRHLEAGVRGEIGRRIEVSVTLFHTRIQDEIYYGEDPATGIATNRNYEDATVRLGLELDLKVSAADNLFVWGNYTFTDGRFEDEGGRIPLVPQHSGSFGLEWRAIEPLTAALTGSWVGERFDGNDPTNELYDPLDPYLLVDLKLTWRLKQFSFIFGINNVFNQLYSVTAYSQSHYPMPTRHLYGGLEWTFE